MSDVLKALLYPPADIAEQRVLGFDSTGAIKFAYKATLLGKLIGANMNVTTDQAIVINSARFALTKIIVTNASISLTTAVGGVYTAASKGGVTAVANTQVYSALTAATKLLSLTIAAAGSADSIATSQLFLSLTTAQGAAATADVYVYGDVFD